MKRFGSSFLGLIIASIFGTVHAYDHRRCSQGVGLSPGNLFPIGAISSSSTSYVSSTGPCRAISAREERAQYYAVNSELIKADIAKGSGEYLSALAILSGCKDERSQNVFGSKLRKSFSPIFYLNDKATAEDRILNKVDELISTDSDLRKLCTPITS